MNEEERISAFLEEHFPGIEFDIDISSRYKKTMYIRVYNMEKELGNIARTLGKNYRTNWTRFVLKGRRTEK